MLAEQLCSGIKACLYASMATAAVQSDTQINRLNKF